MADAVTLSNSAIAALTRPSQNPAPYFFPQSFASQATQVFQTANMAIAPDPTQAYQNLNLIYLYCEDVEDKCSPGVWGYAPDDHNPITGQRTGDQAAMFVVCPAMLDLPGIRQAVPVRPAKLPWDGPSCDRSYSSEACSRAMRDWRREGLRILRLGLRRVISWLR